MGLIRHWYRQNLAYQNTIPSVLPFYQAAIFKTCNYQEGLQTATSMYLKLWHELSIFPVENIVRNGTKCCLP